MRDVEIYSCIVDNVTTRYRFKRKIPCFTRLIYDVYTQNKIKRIAPLYIDFYLEEKQQVEAMCRVFFQQRFSSIGPKKYSWKTSFPLYLDTTKPLPKNALYLVKNLELLNV